jgi:hypothetical protein
MKNILQRIAWLTRRWNLEINLLDELQINCALLCLKISVPEESIKILKGTDKNNNILFGNIPFSQFILNFDYELL